MRIRSNVPAFNAHRHLSRNDVQLGRSLERLSSGLRINRASDDAAGLSISETLRAQVRGTAQAYRNVQDALNFSYSVDSDLQQISGMLQRVRELAVQAGNGTYTLADRQSIQAEIDQLLDTIRDMTNGSAPTNGAIFPLKKIAPNPNPVGVLPAEDFVFVLDNTTNPLTGAMLSDFVTQLQTFANAVQAVRPGSRFGVTLMNQNNPGDNNDAVKRVFDLTSNTAMLSQANLEAMISAAAGTPGNMYRAGNVDPYSAILSSIQASDVGGGGGTGDDFFSWDPAAAKRTMVMITGLDRETDRWGGGGSTETQATLTAALTAADIQLTVVGTPGVTNSADPLDGLGDAITGSGGSFYNKAGGMASMLTDLIPPPPGAYPYVHFQVGANQGQELIVELSDVTLQTLGLDSLDVTSFAGAQAALGALDAAQAQVSLELGKWGGYESRLQHIASNLTVSQLSQMTAESRIRDLDMADEAVQLARWQVLQQAAVASLGQAQRGGTQRMQALLYGT